MYTTMDATGRLPKQKRIDMILDKAAIDAVKNWKFVPAKRGDKAITKNVLVPIEFKLV